MICKYCSRSIPDESIFCLHCGERVARKKKQAAPQSSVPKPTQLKSGEWSAQLMVDGKRVRVKGNSERDYYSKAAAIKAGLIAAKKTPEFKSLSDAIDEYIASRTGTVSPATIQTYKKKKRLYFLDLMTVDIHSITVEMLQAEVQEMVKKGLSPKTVRDSYSFIASVLKFRKIPLDYEGVNLPTVQASPFAVLTEDEQRRLIAGVKGNPCELQILLALWLGLRRSEILALEKSDFDFEHKTVQISKALVMNDNREYVVKGTKTALSARVISCPEYILGLVKDCPEGRIYNRPVEYILKCLTRVCNENGLPHVRLHDLRHINASVGLKLGVPDKYMMERGGWSSKDTMVYRYQHTYSAEKESADSTINDYFVKLQNG